MRSLLFFFFVSAVLVVSPMLSSAEDVDPWGLDVSLSTYSDYIFRGKNVYDGISIQPSVTGYYDFQDYGLLGANVWLQAPGESNEPPEKFNELDTTLFYRISVDKLSFEVGHIFYTFPGGSGRIADTVEFFAGVSADVFLKPSFTVYADYEEGEYQYYTLRLEEDLKLPVGGEATLEVTPFVLFAFASNADDGPVFYLENGLVHIDLGAAINVPVGEHLEISPNFTVSIEDDDALDNEFSFGIDLTYHI